MKLEKILQKYGVNTTTNFDLKKNGDELGLSLKVCMRDELKESKKECIVMNYQTSKETGSHWVAIYKGECYFDPYGIIPPKEVFFYARKDFLL